MVKLAVSSSTREGPSQRWCPPRGSPQALAPLPSAAVTGCRPPLRSPGTPSGGRTQRTAQNRRAEKARLSSPAAGGTCSPPSSSPANVSLEAPEPLGSEGPETAQSRAVFSEQEARARASRTRAGLSREQQLLTRTPPDGQLITLSRPRGPPASSPSTVIASTRGKSLACPDHAVKSEGGCFLGKSSNRGRGVGVFRKGCPPELLGRRRHRRGGPPALRAVTPLCRGHVGSTCRQEALPSLSEGQSNGSPALPGSVPGGRCGTGLRRPCRCSERSPGLSEPRARGCAGGAAAERALTPWNSRVGQREPQGEDDWVAGQRAGLTPHAPQSLGPSSSFK